MSLEPLHLNVLTPTETIREAYGVKYVHVSLADGYPIGIYPGHAPLLAETVAGPLRYADGSGEHALNLAAGILQVDGNVVRILTDGQPQAAEAGANGEIPHAAGTQAQVEREPRFNRLAREMLTALHAQMRGTKADDEG